MTNKNEQIFVHIFKKRESKIIMGDINCFQGPRSACDPSVWNPWTTDWNTKLLQTELQHQFSEYCTTAHSIHCIVGRRVTSSILDTSLPPFSIWNGVGWLSSYAYLYYLGHPNNLLSLPPSNFIPPHSHVKENRMLFAVFSPKGICYKNHTTKHLPSTLDKNELF